MSIPASSVCSCSSGISNSNTTTNTAHNKPDMKANTFQHLPPLPSLPNSCSRWVCMFLSVSPFLCTLSLTSSHLPALFFAELFPWCYFRIAFRLLPSNSSLEFSLVVSCDVSYHLSGIFFCLLFMPRVLESRYYYTVLPHTVSPSPSPSPPSPSPPTSPPLIPRYNLITTATTPQPWILLFRLLGPTTVTRPIPLLFLLSLALLYFYY